MEVITWIVTGIRRVSNESSNELVMRLGTRILLLNRPINKLSKL